MIIDNYNSNNKNNNNNNNNMTLCISAILQTRELGTKSTGITRQALTDILPLLMLWLSLLWPTLVAIGMLLLLMSILLLFRYCYDTVSVIAIYIEILLLLLSMESLPLLAGTNIHTNTHEYARSSVQKIQTLRQSYLDARIHTSLEIVDSLRNAENCTINKCASCLRFFSYFLLWNGMHDK